MDRSISLLARLLLSIVLLSLLNACGGGHQRKVRGEPPQVFIAGIEKIDPQLRLDLQVRNINHLAIERISIQFELFFDQLPAFDQPQELQLSLDGRGTEQLHWSGSASPAVLARLDALSRGEIPNLDYQSRGRVVNHDSGRKFHFSKRGKVFAVPGKPGHYRLAGVSDDSRVNRDKVIDPTNYH